MRITVLGCGTSTGVPLIHCQCPVCRSTDPKNKRLRTSIWIQVEGKSILVDVSPDFRQQVLRDYIPRLDAIIFTHPHYDHIGGVDEIRSYNFIQKETIQAYGHDWTMRDLPLRVPYIFNATSYGGKIEGGGVASIALHEFKLDDEFFEAAGIQVIPISVIHGSQKVAGLRIKNFAYLTDCNAIPESSIERLQNLDVLILDCLRLEKHETHLNLEDALNYSRLIGAKRTIFTHLSHDFDYTSASRSLPKNHELAYDQMIIKI